MADTRKRPRSLWRPPAIVLLVAVALLVLSFVLDTGGERSRDLALLIGAPSLYLLLPLAVLWLAVAVVVQLRRASRPVR
jgi:protein-S-isoprenylcysteine O-methyltransferase Ste14